MSLPHPTPPKPNGLPKPKPSSSSQPSSDTREPFHRVDTLGLRKRLTDQLGPEDAWVYWKGLKEFLAGRASRWEWEKESEGVLDSALKRHLHNQFLTGLLHNSSTTLPHSSTPLLPLPESSTLPTTSLSAKSSSSSLRGLKRSRTRSPSPDTLPPRHRIRSWLIGMNKTEKDKLKKRAQEVEDDAGSGEGEEDAEFSETRKGWGAGGREGYAPPGAGGWGQGGLFEVLGKELCARKMELPSKREMQERLERVAREQGVEEGAGEGLGAFMVYALEAHLEEILHAALHLSKTSRPTSSTIQPIPPTSPTSAPIFASSSSISSPTSPTPTPELTLQDMTALFELAPHLHPHQGDSVWKIRNGYWAGEEAEELRAEQCAEVRAAEWTAYLSRMAVEAALPIPVPEPPNSAGVEKLEQPEKKKIAESYEEYLRMEMERRGVLKIEVDAGVGGKGAAGRVGKKEEGAGATHWGYVDPSDILRDVYP